MKIHLSIFSFLFSAIGLFAQTDTSKLNSIEIKGRIEDMNTGAGLDGVFVFALDEKGDTIAQSVTSSNGKYPSFQLKFGNSYTIWFKKEGFLSKHVLLVSEIPDSTLEYSSNYYLEINGSLLENYFHQHPRCLGGMEEKPAAKAKYNYYIDNFEWDIWLIEKYQKALVNSISCVEQYIKSENDQKLREQEIKNAALREIEAFKKHKPVIIYGSVNEMLSKSKLDGIVVEAWYKNRMVSSDTTDENGNFKLDSIYYGRNYKIWFRHPEYIKNYLIFDFTGIPDTVLKADSIEVNNDMAEYFFKGCDVSTLNQIPIGQLKYDSTTQKIDWNMAVRERYMKELINWVFCALEKRSEKSDKK